MKCVLLKQTAKAQVHAPIAQCGGVMLRMGESLVVRYDLAQAVTRAHPGWFEEGGTLDTPSLRNGVWETRGQGVPADRAPEPDEAPAASEEPVQERAADRSMAGVGKGKKKHK